MSTQLVATESTSTEDTKEKLKNGMIATGVISLIICIITTIMITIGVSTGKKMVAYIGGGIGGIGALSTIGFIVCLVMYFTKK